MNIIGMWKIKKIAMMSPDFQMVMKTVDEILALEDNEESGEYKRMVNTVIKFNEDNTMDMAMKVPEEMLAEAKAQGAPVTDDGLIMIEQKAWKEENGEFFYDSGDEIEINGVKQSSFVKLQFDEEGCILLNGMMLFEKA